MDDRKARFLEAFLFASDGIASREKLKAHLSLNDGQLNSLVTYLQEFYKRSNSSLVLLQDNTHIRLTVHDDFLPYVKSFVKSEFDSAVIKTLAMIAYKSPLKQSDLIKARGNKAYEHIKQLVNTGLVEARDSGNTKVLQVTPKFFKYFNVSENVFKQKIGDFVNGKPVEEDYSLD